MTVSRSPRRVLPGWFALTLGAALALSACGGGGGGGDPGATADASGSAKTLAIDEAAVPPEAEGVVAQPTFHLAPVVLDEPSDADANDNAASAVEAPAKRDLPPEAAGISTQRLTLPALKRALQVGLQAPSLLPLATTSTVTTYTPAQIRAAYGLPALPAPGVTPTATQAAQMGAGQTVYIVNAQHNPNVVAELAAFNQKFGLPTCRSAAISPTAPLPLTPAAAADGCTLSVVYATAAGGMTATVPAYDAGWATEIALDVQWVHATAPLARIVLIEAADPSLNNLVGAIKLANAMGPGVVSMSFGATEGSWTGSVDAAFAGTNMSYFAATGDAGNSVEWPSVSPNVVGVGGTSLTYTGTGARNEQAWASAGGGVSAYVAAPSYQTSLVPGLGTPGKRVVADVAFNADPSTGQYVAVMSPGSTAVSWVSAGGTSLSTPQWAGLTAVANALRAQNGKPPVGLPHGALYTQIATVAGLYGANFADVTLGSNGTCLLCIAKLGFDVPTGLGTPNAGVLLTTLSGTTPVSLAPVVNAATVTGRAGQALAFNLAAVASNPVTWTLTGAPTGMAVNATSGAVSWPSPVAGSYSVTATARDSKTGLTGQGLYTVRIETPATAPVVASATVNASAGTALSYTVAVTGSAANSFALTGAPSGMTVSAAGVIAWPSPLAGTYAVTVRATNGTTGLSGSGVVTFVVAAAQPPVITAPALTGLAGQPLSGSITVASPSGSALSIGISGVPAGVSFSLSGQKITLNWPSPVAGKYNLAVSARDSKGLTAQATWVVTVNAR